MPLAAEQKRGNHTMCKRLYSAITALLLAALLCSCAQGAGNSADPIQNTNNSANVNIQENTEPRYKGTAVADDIIRLDYLNDPADVRAVCGKIYVTSIEASESEEEFSESTRLSIYDMQSGEVLTTKILGDSQTSFLNYYSDGSVGVEFGDETSHYQYFSSSLEPIGEAYEWTYSDTASYPVFRKELVYRIESGVLKCRDLTDGTVKDLLEDLAEGSYICAADESFVYISSSENVKVQRLRLSTLEMKDFKSDNIFEFEYKDDHIYAAPYGYCKVRILDEGTSFCMEDGFDGESRSAFGGGYFITHQAVYNDSSVAEKLNVKAYRMSDGSLMAKYDGKQFSENCTWLGPCSISDDGKYLIVCSSESDESDFGKTNYYLIPTENWAPMEKHTDPALDAKTYAKKLGSDYGVEIIVGEDVLAYPGGDYTVDAVSDEEDTSKTLKELEKTLGKFPEGFFREYSEPCGEEYGPNKIKFYITGNIYGPDYSTSTIAALTTPEYDMCVESNIALDVKYTNNMEYNIAHELWHAIEDRLTFGNDDMYDTLEEWLDFLPYGTYYNYGYRNNSGEDYDEIRYTLSDPVDGNAYFIDSYSLTWPHEDRARVFENMFIAGNSSEFYETPWPFGYQGLYDKAKWISDILRKEFKSVEACGIPHWDKIFYPAEAPESEGSVDIEESDN